MDWKRRLGLVLLGTLTGLGFLLRYFTPDPRPLPAIDPNVDLQGTKNRRIAPPGSKILLKSAGDETSSLPSSRENSSQNLEAPSYARKPAGNIVEFEVNKEGLAIAYGDILLGKPEDEFKGSKGHYEAPMPKTWDTLEIPYLISPDLPDPKRVEKAIEYFKQHTPIQFVPYQNQADAIVFQPGNDHCYSYLGKIGGLQGIHLEKECQTQEIIHEIMHALGFVHEQSRPDRDQYVRINWENIDPKYQSQFAMVPEGFFEFDRTSPFDYHSIMMYSTQMFATQAQHPTMQSLSQETISPVPDGLSDGDIRRIRQLYRH